MRQQAVLGVDVGGVIIDRAKNDGTDTSFLGDNYLVTTAVPGAIETLAALSRRLEGRIYVVSKCGRRVQEKTLHWFEEYAFFERTGISPVNVRFCRKRHEKAPICTALGITDFVDDRLEVLSYMNAVPRRYLFRPDPSEIAEFSRHLPAVIQVKEWSEVAEQLLRT